MICAPKDIGQDIVLYNIIYYIKYIKLYEIKKKFDMLKKSYKKIDYI